MKDWRCRLIRSILVSDDPVNDELWNRVHLGGIDEALSTLTDREQVVLRSRFKDGLTLAKTGEQIRTKKGNSFLCRQSVTLIQRKALRKLRHPVRLRVMGLTGDVIDRYAPNAKVHHVTGWRI